MTLEEERFRFSTQHPNITPAGSQLKRFSKSHQRVSEKGHLFKSLEKETAKATSDSNICSAHTLSLSLTHTCEIHELFYCQEHVQTSEPSISGHQPTKAPWTYWPMRFERAKLSSR